MLRNSINKVLAKNMISASKSNIINEIDGNFKVVGVKTEAKCSSRKNQDQKMAKSKF